MLIKNPFAGMVRQTLGQTSFITGGAGNESEKQFVH